MLEQVLDMSQLPSSSLEETRQKRLTYFSPMQQHERMLTAPDDRFMHLSAERKAEIGALKKYKVNNRSNNDHSFSQQVKHSFNSDGDLTGRELSGRPSYNSDNSFLENIQAEEVSRLDSEEPFPCSHLLDRDEVDSVELNYNALGLAKIRPGSSIEKKKNTNCKADTPRHKQVIPSNKQITPSHRELRKAAEILSDKTWEELKSVFGDDALRYVLVKIAVDLKLMKVTSPHITEVNRSETGTSIDDEAQSGKLIRPPSVDNSEMSTGLPSRQPSNKFQENMLSFHGMPSTFTKDLQQFKEGEKQIEMLSRNYSQVTVPLFTRSTFSTDKIYKQAYDTNYQHRDQNFYGQTSSEPSHHPWQDRQEHLSSSDGISRFPQKPLSFNSASSLTQNFSNPLYQDLLLYQSAANQVQTFEIKNVVPSTSSSNPSSSCMPPSQPLRNYSSFNAQLPREMHQDLKNKLPAYYTPGSPQASSAGLQPAPSTCKYYPASNAATFGDPTLAYGIPLRVLLPVQHAGVIRPQLQPNPPAAPRRDGSSQLGVSAQVRETTAPRRDGSSQLGVSAQVRETTAPRRDGSSQLGVSAQVRETTAPRRDGSSQLGVSAQVRETTAPRRDGSSQLGVSAQVRETTAPRRDGSSQLGVSAQVTSNPLSTFDQQIRASLPPPVVPPEPKDESRDPLHDRPELSNNPYLDPQLSRHRTEHSNNPYLDPQLSRHGPELSSNPYLDPQLPRYRPELGNNPYLDLSHHGPEHSNKPYLDPQLSRHGPELSSNPYLDPQLPRHRPELSSNPYLDLSHHGPSNKPYLDPQLPELSNKPYLDPQMLPQDNDFRIYNLQRYFSLLEVNDTIPSDCEPSFSSSQVQYDDLFNRSDIAESVGMDFTEATNNNAGGVTQRLNDLDINLDQFKHLGFHGANGGEELASAGVEGFPKGIRCCPECKSSNRAYMNWCTGCGELLMGIEPTYPKEKVRHGSSDERRGKGLEKVTDERNLMPSDDRRGKSLENITDRNLMPADEMHDVEPCQGEDDESLESGRGFSASGSPAEYDLEQDNLREPEDSGRESSDILKEKDIKPADDVCDKKDKSIPNEGRKQNDCRNVDKTCDDTELDFLDQVTDPILREIIISYRRRQLLQKASQKVNHEFEQTDTSTTGYESIANLGATGSLMFNADLNNKLGNFQESKTTPQPQIHVLNPAEVVSFENKVEIKESGLVPSHFKYEADISFEKGGRKIKREIDSRNKELPVEISKTKKKKKITNEALTDVKVFGCDDTHKSSHSANKVVVPTLKLVRSSDEEEEEDEVMEDETVDKESNEMAICAACRTNPVKIKCAPNQSDEDCQNSITSKATKKTLIKRNYASPPKPCLSQSEVPLNRRNQGEVKCSVPYQRHWARSSISWSSFKPRELSTRSSLTNLVPRNGPHKGVGSTPVLAHINHQSGSHLEAGIDLDGAKVSHRPSTADGRRRQAATGSYQRPSSAATGSYQRPSSATGSYQRPSSAATGSHQRPSSANVPSRSSGLQVLPPAERRRSGFSRAMLNRSSVATPGVQRDATTEMKSRPASQTTPDSSYGSSSSAARATEAVVQPGSAAGKEVVSQSDSPRLLCANPHRLPHEVVHTDHHVGAKNAYERLLEMTPRIAEGVLSLWHCLPDEIWLFTCSFLSHGDLRNLMLVSRYFHRLANDETLWKYITVKPRYAMTDASLATIAHHQPLSLAMVKCQGHSLSQDGLLYFFKETQGRLKELNICGCSQGSLVGSVVLLTAANYCQHLTHLDASFCQLNNEAFLAVSNSAYRLESVCVNGFQTMNDISLLTLLMKHGKSLRTLELYACFTLNAFAFHNIGKFCTDLRRLCLGNCNKLTDSVMINLSLYLCKIQELDLRGCKNLWDNCIHKIVRNCHFIHTLVLANCNQISDAALLEISTYLKSTLRVLDVCGCSRISDNGVVSLAKNCSQLTSLDISSTTCTSVSVTHLTNSVCNKWLETVKLSFLSGLNEACLLALIQHCPRLRSIHVFGCSSLKSLAKLQTGNPKLLVEGDTDVSR